MAHSHGQTLFPVNEKEATDPGSHDLVGLCFFFPPPGWNCPELLEFFSIAGCARSIHVEHKVSLPARALSTHTWSTQTSWIVWFVHTSRHWNGHPVKAKAVPLPLPSHLLLGLIWTWLHLVNLRPWLWCQLWPPFHLGNSLNSIPGVGTPVLLCSACLSAPSPCRKNYPGALQWSQHSQTLLFSAVSSFPVRLAMLTLESLVAVLLLQPFCPGPSHSFISAGLILNIDFGLWVCSHIPPLCLASSQDPGQGQIPGDPLPRKERWAYAVQFCCFSWFELSCCPRWSHPESSPYSTEFHRLIHSNEKNLATKFIGIEKLGVIWSNTKSGAPDITSALWYPALLTPGSTELTSLLVQKPTSFPRPKMLCTKTCRRLSTLQALLSDLIFV